MLLTCVIMVSQVIFLTNLLIMYYEMLLYVITANICGGLYHCIATDPIIQFYLCEDVVVILTHLLTCFPGIECGLVIT